MHEPDDHDLLRQFAEQNSETAFAALVARHVDKVYSAALRHTRNAHAAEEITQAVFVILAKKSGRLGAKVILAGWLYETARLTALTYIRSEIRRARREQEAHMQTALNENADDAWPHIAPLLDNALAGLSAADRHAVVLRYFDGKSLGEVGAALGASEDAAKKRVTRAVEKLRGWFTKRGVTLTATVLTAAISANSVQAAPLGLAKTISIIAITKGATAGGSTLALVKGALKIMAWTKMKTAVAVGVGAVLVGTSVYQAQQVAKLREQNLALQQQQTPLAEQILQLQRERDKATNQLAGLLADNSHLKSNPHQMELLKLRGEVTRLRTEAEQSNDPMVKKALLWKANVEKTRQLFAEHPEQQIPEMKLLSDDYFFDLARDQDLESSNGVRKAFSEIRDRAANEFSNKLQEALQKFYQTNSNQAPDTVLALASLFDPPMDNAILERYHLIDTGKSIVGGWSGGWAISQKDTPDLDYDRQWFISPVGFSSAPFKQPEKY